MAEGLKETRIKASELAGDLFDALVERHLEGRILHVVVEWDGEFSEMDVLSPGPHVTIDGVEARGYCRDLMGFTTTDSDLIEATAKEFEDIVGGLWDNTIEYYEELDALGPMMDSLAMSPSAGFLDEARRSFAAQGVEPIRVDLLDRARWIACTALVGWADAVEGEDTKN